ncbi:MAG TPA: uracil-DNA glycosylase family protein [Novosphingobium sp.]|nr:uracil-DNA glycosylase family protein [Novosphingobium sp.]
MVHAPNPEFLDDITGALGWWREAGVDCDFLDEPRQWLAPAEEESRDERQPERPRRAEETAAPPPPSRFDPATLPRDLGAFQEWWLKDPLLDEGVAGRIPPCGEAGTKLMIVVDMPEPDDDRSLLSGPQGKLLDAMLRAFGTRRDDVYLASALPRAVPAPDWGAMSDRGLGQVLAHHVKLAAPERLIVLGSNVLPLLGHELPQRSAVLWTFNHEGTTIPLLASRGLSALLAQPRWKAALWQAWLEWTRD